MVIRIQKKIPRNVLRPSRLQDQQHVTMMLRSHNIFSQDKYTYSGDIISANGEQEIQRAIMAGGPMETAFTVFTDFEDYGGGIYHNVGGYVAGGHAVTFVGW